MTTKDTSSIGSSTETGTDAAPHPPTSTDAASPETTPPPVIRVDTAFESEAVQTADGSSTLLHPIYAQTYHSHHGAIRESMHVFLGHSDLHARLEQGPVRLLEIGIGTGLNLALSASLSKARGGTLHYMGIEQFPPEQSALQTLDYGQHDAVDDAVWQECLLAFDARRPTWSIEQHTRAECHWGRFEDATLPPAHFDIVYHDAFSPNVNPECWNDEALTRIVDAMQPGGVLVTYTVQGAVRRALARLGLHVERLPGPKDGKRQVLRAIKPKEATASNKPKG